MKLEITTLSLIFFFKKCLSATSVLNMAATENMFSSTVPMFVHINSIIIVISMFLDIVDLNEKCLTHD